MMRKLQPLCANCCHRRLDGSGSSFCIRWMVEDDKWLTKPSQAMDEAHYLHIEHPRDFGCIKFEQREAQP